MGRSRSECTGFIVSGNDRPHPNLLPRGEGTAIACVSLRGCVSCESSRERLVVQGFKARVCWRKSLPVWRGEGVRRDSVAYFAIFVRLRSFQKLESGKSKCRERFVQSFQQKIGVGLRQTHGWREPN